MHIFKPEKKWRYVTRISILLVGLLQLFVGQHIAFAGTGLRDLSDGEQTAIYGGSAALFFGGGLVRHAPSGRPINRSYRSTGLDRFMRNLIHGAVDTSSNFIDNHIGGIITPVAALAAISIIDINRHEFSRDIPIYLAGWAATNGITLLTKSAVKRPRPYCQEGGCPPPDLPPDAPTHHRSFVSGHTSMAFYGAAFFNQRFRQFMRTNWTADEYRAGRWVSPILSFGWAGFVGLSRIHADKHHFTDVLAGALLGTAMAELYYWLAYETSEVSNSAGAGGLRLSLRFSF